MVGLPKRLIKKYGVSKRAWAVFRGEKGTKTRKVTKHMARRRYAKVRRVGRAVGNKLMNGLYKPSGIVENALLGVGASAAVDKFGGNLNIPYKNEIAAFVVGGVPGAAAVYLLRQNGGNTGGSGIELN